MEAADGNATVALEYFDMDHYFCEIDMINISVIYRGRDSIVAVFSLGLAIGVAAGPQPPGKGAAFSASSHPI